MSKMLEEMRALVAQLPAHSSSAPWMLEKAKRHAFNAEKSFKYAAQHPDAMLGAERKAIMAWAFATMALKYHDCS